MKFYYQLGGKFMTSDKLSLANEKLAQARQLMEEEAIDTWLIVTREGTDPALPLLIGIRSVHLAVIILRSDGKHVAITSVIDEGAYKATHLFDQVFPYESSIDEVLVEVFEKLS